MESFTKQMRVRLSGWGQKRQEEPISARERIPPQKTQLFKGEQKKVQNWLRRQFSGQMSRDYDNNEDDEFFTAVAAAAFAINSLEETGDQSQKFREGPERNIIKIKSKKEDRTIKDTISPGEASMRRPKVPGTVATSEIMPEKDVDKVPSIKRTPTLAGQNLSGMSSMPPKMAPPPSAIMPGKVTDKVPSTTRTPPQVSSTGDDKQKVTSTRPGSIDSTADAWEKAEMDKINERYKKMNSRILEWENRKMSKAKRRLDRREAEVEQQRARALQNYRKEITRIDQIAGGARAKLEEQRRYDEAMAKEKAQKVRATGKVPATCLCF